MVNRQAGSALVTVLGVAALVAVMAVALASLVESRQAEVVRSENRAKAQALADAALAESLAQLAQSPVHFRGIPERRWGRGSIESTVTRESGIEVATVVAVGRSQAYVVTLTARVRVDPLPPRVLSWSRTQGVE